jgi:hypothetical protein
MWARDETREAMNNNMGQAKVNPEKSYELAYAILADGCRRFLEGKIQEHKSYKFYCGSQIRVFITDQQYKRLRQMLKDECIIVDSDVDDLRVNGKNLGVWSTYVGYGKMNCQLCLTLSPEFERKHSIVKRFAQLAAKPLSAATKLHYCTKCGFPMVKPVDGDWLCDDCAIASSGDDLF